MKNLFSLIFWGIVFCAVALTMFFTVNPFLVVILLVVWQPLEKCIDKVSANK